jgi:CspA family cold shock protein
MERGSVKWFDSKKGYGFIVNEQGQDCFIHYTNILGEGFRGLKDGQQVEYEQFQSEKGLACKNVRVIKETETEKSSEAQPE